MDSDAFRQGGEQYSRLKAQLERGADHAEQFEAAVRSITVTDAVGRPGRWIQRLLAKARRPPNYPTVGAAPLSRGPLRRDGSARSFAPGVPLLAGCLVLLCLAGFAGVLYLATTGSAIGSRVADAPGVRPPDARVSERACCNTPLVAPYGNGNPAGRGPDVASTAELAPTAPGFRRRASPHGWLPPLSVRRRPSAEPRLAGSHTANCPRHQPRRIVRGTAQRNWPAAPPTPQLPAAPPRRLSGGTRHLCHRAAVRACAGGSPAGHCLFPNLSEHHRADQGARWVVLVYRPDNLRNRSDKPAISYPRFRSAQNEQGRWEVGRSRRGGWNVRIRGTRRWSTTTRERP